ncbi:MAG: hypothetical protein NHG09_00650 [Candidatus Shikimatogenerans sp. JK-2022]|nr:hypothetical protein [Candidatus Shikimatogenerans bostrichidophilus]
MNILIIKIKKKNKNNKKIKKIIKNLGYKVEITNNIKKILNYEKIIISSNFKILEIIRILKKKKIYYLIKKIKKNFLVLGNCINFLCYKYKKYNFLNIFKNLIINKKKIKKGNYKIYYSKYEKIFKGLPKKNFKQKIYNKNCINLGKFAIAHYNYNFSYSAGLKKKKIYGFFFNPEYSGKYGIKIIKNFIKLNEKNN